MENLVKLPETAPTEKIEKLLQELILNKKLKNADNYPCLFNLIIYAKKEHIGSYLCSVVKRMANQYPCRILIIQEEHNLETDTIRAEADNIDFASLPYDIYTLHVAPSQKKELYLYLFPLLKADLPIFLLWAENPLECHPREIGMEPYLTKVIMDSDSSASISEFASKALEIVEHSAYAFSDLNWNRIEQWQQLFAYEFNRAKKLALIQNAKEITISFNPTGDGLPVQAIYLQAWIALKLGWQIIEVIRSNDTFTFLYKNGSSEVPIQLTPKPMETLSSGRIHEVVIKNGDQITEFNRQEKHPHIVTIKHSNPEYCEIPSQYFFDEERFGRSLGLEIHKRSSHPTLVRVLRRIAAYSGLSTH